MFSAGPGSLSAPHAAFQRPQIVSALLLPFAASTSRKVFPGSGVFGEGYGSQTTSSPFPTPGSESANVMPAGPTSSPPPRRVSLEDAGSGHGGRRSLQRQASTRGAWLREDAAGIAGCGGGGGGGGGKGETS